MKLTINRVKKLAAALIILPFLAALSVNTATVRTRAADEDLAALYKAKCAMCHGQKAEKAFDMNKTDDQHVEAIMKGVKGEKPPFMPAYETKGISADQSKALVAYMRSLRQ